ncbi:hypothetical protein F183_A13440 [Bryobacterales bacterium F-183]|nr:hypothetical protein F183_A13440 [Bryobacterales bacterium F-183]
MEDLRQPSGLFFVLLGAILIGVSFTGATAPLLEINLNLYTGLFMLVFGGALLWLAKRPS